MQPVEIEHFRDHKFVKPPKGGKGCRFGLPSGATCSRAKTNPLHHGAVPSLNVAGSGSNHFVYQAAKKEWSKTILGMLRATDLPLGCEYILVEGLVCFPDRIVRDQGNFRYFIEKVTGDTLVQGSYIADDSWDQYEFGNLQKTYRKGEAWTRLMFFPR